MEDAALVKAASGPEQVLQGADRAINSVSYKLDATLSVEYTVNELINAARDPANLARIFPGELLQCNLVSFIPNEYNPSGWSPQC